MLAFKLLLFFFIFQHHVFGQRDNSIRKKAFKRPYNSSRKGLIKLKPNEDLFLNGTTIPHEVTTTPGEVTTISQEVTTTPQVVTTPNEEVTNPSQATTSIDSCSHGESAYNKNDLQIIIEASLPNFIELLNESFYANAITMRDEHWGNLNEFEKRLEHRPEHLNHILEDMVHTRQRIEPMVIRFESALTEFASYENGFNETLEKVKVVTVALERTKSICQLNCDNTLLEYRSNPILQNEYICSSFDKVIGKINSEMEKSKHEFLIKIENRLNNDSETYQRKIKNLKDKLKEASIQQFGLTMYNILSLQDDYFHFSEGLEKHNIIVKLHDIKRINYEINSKVVELQSLVKKYRSYCNNCYQYRTVLGAYTSTQSEENNKERKTILEKVLDYEINKVEVALDAEYSNIFKELNEKVEGADEINTFLSKLKPIQGEVTEKIKNETDTLNNLQSLVPKSSIEKVIKLSNLSKEVARRLDDDIRYVLRYI